MWQKVASVYFYLYLFLCNISWRGIFSQSLSALCCPWAFTLSPLAPRMCPWISEEELLKNFFLSFSFYKQHSFSKNGKIEICLWLEKTIVFSKWNKYVPTWSSSSLPLFAPPTPLNRSNKQTLQGPFLSLLFFASSLSQKINYFCIYITDHCSHFLNRHL